MTKLDQLSDNLSDLKQVLTKSQSDLTHTLRETRMYMFKDIRKACEDAGLSHDQWIAVEAELQAQFDRFFEEQTPEDHDCHASPEDGCAGCEKQLDELEEARMDHLLQDSREDSDSLYEAQ